MGYTPMILISKSDLHEKASVIEEQAWMKQPRKVSEKAQRIFSAYKELESLLSHEGVKICGTVLVIAKPEFTEHNREVRSLLRELNIEYAVYD